MKKINLSAFKNDGIILDELLTVRGGCGYSCDSKTSSNFCNTKCSGGDVDHSWSDSDD